MTRGLTILIVEDTESDLDLLRIALRRNNIQNPIQVCSDGAEAIGYLQGHGRYASRTEFPFPSVIFLDLKLPKVSGMEVLKWLKEHPACNVIPVIVLTSSAQHSDVAEAYRLGANSYMVKPNTLDDLVRMIRLAFDYWAICEKPPVPENC